MRETGEIGKIYALLYAFDIFKWGNIFYSLLMQVT